MSGSAPRPLPPVLGRLLSGTFWLALRVPLQVVFSLWTTRLVLEAIGPDGNGAYRFAWGFGFFQFLFEFGASSALQRQISDAWTRGDRDGVDRAIASGMNFYAAMAILQVAALLGVAYWGLPHSDAPAQLVSPGHQAAVAPGDDGPVLRLLGGRLERAPGGAAIRLRAAVRAGDHRAAVPGAGRWAEGRGRFLLDRRDPDGDPGGPGPGPGALGDGPRAGSRRRISAVRGGTTTRRWGTSASISH